MQQPIRSSVSAECNDLVTKQKKDKKTITWLSVSTGILLVFVILFVIGLFYVYHSFQPYIQDMITSGKVPPQSIMRLLFKSGTIFVD